MRRTNRILSVYSVDISGVCLALYELGGMIVMHDAPGRSSTYATHDEPRWYPIDSMVYISALSELEAVMGDDGKLVRDIVDAARSPHPRFICMGGTPIPMMMGTDFEGIARMIEEETKIPTFGTATNRIHSYVQGAGEALRQIAVRFCPSGEELWGMAGEGVHDVLHGVPVGSRDTRLCVNLLGTTPLGFSLTGNVAGVKAFLASHGMGTLSYWAMESSLDEVRLAGLTDVNLVVSAAGIPPAMELERKYGAPYVVGTPVGRRAALRLAGLLRLGAGAGKSQSLFTGGNGHRDPSDGPSGGPWGGSVDLGLTGPPEDLSGEHILIVGEQVTAGSLRCSLREDLGAGDIHMLYPTEGGAGLAEPGDILVWDEDEAIVAMEKSIVVIANPSYRQVCPGNGWQVFVGFPHEACSGHMYHDRMKPFVCGV